jgi:hypothetical protein
VVQFSANNVDNGDHAGRVGVGRIESNLAGSVDINQMSKRRVLEGVRRDDCRPLHFMLLGLLEFSICRWLWGAERLSRHMHRLSIGVPERSVPQRLRRGIPRRMLALHSQRVRLQLR